MKNVLISYATSGHSGRTVSLKFSTMLARTVLKLKRLEGNVDTQPLMDCVTFKMAV